MKYYQVKSKTKAEAWLQEYSQSHADISRRRHALLTRLLGRRKKKAIVQGARLVGCTYATGKLPDENPGGLKVAKGKLNGEHYYVPDKRVKAGRDIASEFQRLQIPSLSPLCKILGVPDCSFSDRGMRFNAPGVIEKKYDDAFLICVHDDLKPDAKQVTRISDLEWEQAKGE